MQGQTVGGGLAFAFSPSRCPHPTPFFTGPGTPPRRCLPAPAISINSSSVVGLLLFSGCRETSLRTEGSVDPSYTLAKWEKEPPRSANEGNLLALHLSRVEGGIDPAGHSPPPRNSLRQIARQPAYSPWGASGQERPVGRQGLAHLGLAPWTYRARAVYLRRRSEEAPSVFFLGELSVSRGPPTPHRTSLHRVHVDRGPGRTGARERQAAQRHSGSERERGKRGLAEQRSACCPSPPPQPHVLCRQEQVLVSRHSPLCGRGS